MTYLDTLFDIKDRVVLITGGGGVLAAAIGKGFIDAGATVILADIRLKNAEENAKNISSSGGRAEGVRMDALDKKDIKECCASILKNHKRIDILVNAAGGNMKGATINPGDSVFDMDIEEFDKVSDLNYKAAVLPSLVVGKIMADQEHGSIINISSMAAMRAITRVVGYSAAKAAISNFTQWMAMEMAMKYKGMIRVNAIAPGFFIGDQNRALLTESDGSYTDRGKQVVQNTPMGRFGNADELVGAVLYLASGAASFVTGVILPVDGGFSFYSGV